MRPPRCHHTRGPCRTRDGLVRCAHAPAGRNRASMAPPGADETPTRRRQPAAGPPAPPSHPVSPCASTADCAAVRCRADAPPLPTPRHRALGCSCDPSASPAAPMADGEAVLRWAAGEGGDLDDDVVAPHADVADAEGSSALLIAAFAGNVGAVARLLRLGADVSTANASAGWTPLHAAAFVEHVHIAQLLVDGVVRGGADAAALVVNAVAADGHTALDYVLEGETTGAGETIASMLRAAGGRTAAELAAVAGGARAVTPPPPPPPRASASPHRTPARRAPAAAAAGSSGWSAAVSPLRSGQRGRFAAVSPSAAVAAPWSSAAAVAAGGAVGGGVDGMAAMRGLAHDAEGASPVLPSPLDFVAAGAKGPAAVEPTPVPGQGLPGWPMWAVAAAVGAAIVAEAGCGGAVRRVAGLSGCWRRCWCVRVRAATGGDDVGGQACASITSQRHCHRVDAAGKGWPSLPPAQQHRRSSRRVAQQAPARNSGGVWWAAATQLKPTCWRHQRAAPPRPPPRPAAVTRGSRPPAAHGCCHAWLRLPRPPSHSKR